MHNQVQERFFNLITTKEPLYASLNNPIQTYKEMIHYRFKEVILSVYPRFVALLDQSALDPLIEQFIQSEPKSPFIWQMPDEFRHFAATTELPLAFPFLEELLWFEWIEVELNMRPYALDALADFSWERPASLSSSAVIRYLDYPCFTDQNISAKGEYAVLLYYHFGSDEVHFQEITPFMCQFLNLLEEHLPRVALEIIALEYDVDKEELYELLEEPLREFSRIRVISPH